MYCRYLYLNCLSAGCCRSVFTQSKRSISRLEQGESVQVDNLFKILLGLELGDNIELLVPDQTKRPSFYLEKTVDKPKRVRKKIKKSEFKWGDEQ